MTGFVSALLSVKKFLKRLTTTKVSQVRLQSGDVPSFAVCPHPSVNVSALEKLDGFNMTLFNQTRICKMKGCDSLDNFGRFVEKNKMESERGEQLYNDLKFTAFEVVEDVVVQLTNSSMISVLKLGNTRYMLPLYEMGDCPVFKVPGGLGDTAKIM